MSLRTPTAPAAGTTIVTHTPDGQTFRKTYSSREACLRALPVARQIACAWGCTIEVV